MVLVSHNKLAAWSPIEPPQRSYTYNDPTLTYNQAGVGFDYLDPIKNQENNKQPIEWEPDNR